MQRMESDPRVGTTSGKPWFVHPQNGALMPEVCGDEMSVGMTKFYRVTCFREIGGFVREGMWGGLDWHPARTPRRVAPNGGIVAHLLDSPRFPGSRHDG